MIEVDGFDFVVDELNIFDIKEMIKIQEDINNGKVDTNNEVWNIWKRSACQGNQSYELLTYSTVFPLRLGLAIQRWYTLLNGI